MRPALLFIAAQVLMACASTGMGPASCPVIAGSRADWCDGRVTKVGLLMKYDEVVNFVDLERKDPTTRSPYLYHGACLRCPLQVGSVYRARMDKQEHLNAIFLNGVEITSFPHGPDSPMAGPFIAYTCESGPSHWEEINQVATCKPGAKDPMKWTSASEPSRENANLPRCNAHQGFSNRTLTVTTTVSPAAGMQWDFREAPAELARRLLDDLNHNTRAITFTEANGVSPNFVFAVTMLETHEGTQQDSAEVEVTGLSEAGTLFNLKSGEAPFTGWPDAIDHLATNMLVYFETGWHHAPPCLRPDGSVENH